MSTRQLKGHFLRLLNLPMVFALLMFVHFKILKEVQGYCFKMLDLMLRVFQDQ